MNAQASDPNPHDDDMPAEIDFSRGMRGKFFKPGARLNVPLYLEPQVQAYLTERAQAKA